MEPLQDDYIDSGNEEPASYAIVRTQLKRYTVSFFKTQNQLYMIRIEIPNVPDDTIPESDCDIIQIIKEHLLSVLRLTYDHDVSLFPRPIWNFIREGEKPSLHVRIGKIVNPSFDPHLENIRNVFVKTLPLRVQTKLLSDSQDKRLPLQYRYLSLYKLLELEFKKERKWVNEYEEFLDSFKADFKNLEIQMKPKNYIICLRDKCAHITTGKDVIAITQLSNKDMAEIDKFLPLMTRICVRALDKKHPRKGFSLVDAQTFIRGLGTTKLYRKHK